MTEVKKQSIVDNLTQLGRFFELSLDNEAKSEVEALNPLLKKSRELIDTAYQKNSWFTPEAVQISYSAWAKSLSKDAVENWLGNYELKENSHPKKVGVIMAGNIPMVGMHDALSVLVSGNILHAKLSSKDEDLMALVLDALSAIDNEWANRIHRVDQMKEADVFIATGNDNSARYFEYYFRDKPKIIRKNRTALAILSNDAPEAEIEKLADDVFTYFGLGCRNVTKVYIPQDFDLDRLFKAFYKYKDVVQHNQYANNYDYNKAVYLMTQVELVENGFLLLKEDEGIHSPLGVLFYERYNELKDVEKKLKSLEDEIQVVVSDFEHPEFENLGKAQQPELWDYADGVDTLRFLLEA
ncbi:MAG: acyl-CoA reductase [Flavobacteriales bacterium]|nr:acyl-CoA reductase [Flavobacteriales bacterium]